MSVELLDNSAFYGYRVRRKINGKLYQEYFTLKKFGKRVGSRFRKEIRQDAIARDNELAKEKSRVDKILKPERCFHTDGSIKGIHYQTSLDTKGNIRPRYQIGIQSELENKVVCTTVSITSHGNEKAWKMVIDKFALHKKIGKKSKLYKKLMSAKARVMPKAPVN